MQLLKQLPGYTLHHDPLPSGTRVYWYPTSNQFPQWVNPTVMNSDTGLGSQKLVSTTVPLTSGNTAPSITLDVPKGWTMQKEGQGDTSGEAWVNPSDQNQQIQVMVTGNMSAFQNLNTGQWDVRGIFGKGTADVSWSNVSTNRMTADFTDSRKINFYAKDEQTPYTGYGKAFIVKKPNPFAVYVEVWGNQSLASSVLTTVQLQQQ